MVIKTGDVISFVPPTASNQNFQYETVYCEVQDLTVEEIATDTTGFYLNKTISYGDFWLIFFLTFFSLFMMFSWIWRFVFREKFNFRNP